MVGRKYSWTYPGRCIVLLYAATFALSALLSSSVRCAAAALDPANILVAAATGNTVSEYTPSGTLVRIIQFTYGSRNYSDLFASSESLRGITVDGYGQIAAFNGTFTPFLSRFNPDNGAFQHSTFPGWSVFGVSYYGSVSAFQQYVFAQDNATGAGGLGAGVVRFDIETGHAQRFNVIGVDVLHLNIAPDGKLYVLVTRSGSNDRRVNIYDPTTTALLGYVDLPSTGDSFVTAATADRFGSIFFTTFSGIIYRLNAVGVIDGQLSTGRQVYDLSIDDTDRLITGGDGRVAITDTSLVSINSFDVGSSVYVSFARPVPAVNSPLPPPDPPVAPTPTPVPIRNIFVAVGNALAGTAGQPEENTVREFNQDGTFLGSTQFRYRNGAYFQYEFLRDVTVSSSRNLLAFNGTFEPYLTTYSATSKSFSDTTYPGWTYINRSQGGSVALYNNYAFVADLDSSGFGEAGRPNGIVRFDTTGGTAARFADGVDVFEVNVGLDGKVYALFERQFEGVFINVYDPISSQFLYQLSLPAEVGLEDRSKAIAVDAQGRIFLAGDYGAVYRLDAAGKIEASIATSYPHITDLEVDETGQLTAVQQDGYVLVGYTSLDHFTAFRSIINPSAPIWSIAVGLGPLKGGSAPLGPAVHVSPPPSPTVSEGYDITFSVTLDAAVNKPVAVSYILGGTARNGADYTVEGTYGSILFPVGERSATVVLHTIVDHVKEKKESVTMTPTAGPGYSVPKKTIAKASIVDAP